VKNVFVSRLFLVSTVVVVLSSVIFLDSCKARKAKRAEKDRADSAAAAQAQANEMTMDSDWLIDSMNRAETLQQKYDSIARAAAYATQKADSMRKADSIAYVERIIFLRDSTRIADSIAASKKKPKGK
jgi:hypothetical protein